LPATGRRGWNICISISDEAFSFTTASGAGATITRSIDEGRLKVDTVRVGVSYLFN
jgi:hypothetical protein